MALDDPVVCSVAATTLRIQLSAQWLQQHLGMPDIKVTGNLPSTFECSSAIHRYLLPFGSFPEEKRCYYVIGFLSSCSKVSSIQRVFYHCSNCDPQSFYFIIIGEETVSHFDFTPMLLQSIRGCVLY
jgi:hypothetical protein